MNDWLWHLFNDPVQDNPWSMGLLFLILGSWLAVASSPLIRNWWRHRHD